jgi:CRISPR-associated endoribonuclease Cas6
MIACFALPWEHRGPNSLYEGAMWAALKVIGAADPALAQALHDENALPAYSAALAGDTLHLVALRDDVVQAVAHSPLARQHAARLDVVSFAQFLAGAPETPLVRLRFLTPFQVRHGGQSDVLPTPEKVFASLVRRWQACGGPDLPRLKLGEVATLRLNVETQKVRYASIPRTLHGITGSVLYRAPDEEARHYHALARFGEYAGVGRRTTQGWGRIACGGGPRD